MVERKTPIKYNTHVFSCALLLGSAFNQCIVCLLQLVPPLPVRIPRLYLCLCLSARMVVIVSDCRSSYLVVLGSFVFPVCVGGLSVVFRIAFSFLGKTPADLGSLCTVTSAHTPLHVVPRFAAKGTIRLRRRVFCSHRPSKVKPPIYGTRARFIL